MASSMIPGNGGASTVEHPPPSLVDEDVGVEGSLDSLDSELGNLMNVEIPQGRQSLTDSYTNLERVGEYCRNNYVIQNSAENRGCVSDSGISALEETKNYTTQSLASVAYQINTLAYNFLQMLDLQALSLDDMGKRVKHISNVVEIHREKVARREIGMLTCNKSITKQYKIVAPPSEASFVAPGKNSRIHKALNASFHTTSAYNNNSSGIPSLPQPASKYIRKPIDYSCLDSIGHGARTQPSSRNSMTSLTGLPAVIEPPSQQEEIYYRGLHFNGATTSSSSTLTRRPSGAGGNSIYGTTTTPRPGQVKPPQVPSHYGTIGPSGGVGQRKASTVSMPVNNKPPFAAQFPHVLNNQMNNKKVVPVRDQMVSAGRSTPPIGPPMGVSTTGSSSLPNWVPRSYIDKVRTVYEYSADKEDELSFGEDVLIYVVKKNDDGWWEGVMDGITGLFPGNYVQPFSD